MPTTDPALPGYRLLKATETVLSSLDEDTSWYNSLTTPLSVVDNWFTIHSPVEAVTWSSIPRGLSVYIQWYMPPGFTFPDVSLACLTPDPAYPPLSVPISDGGFATRSDVYMWNGILPWPHTDKSHYYIDLYPLDDLVARGNASDFLTALAAGTVEVAVSQINLGGDPDPYIRFSALGLAWPVGTPPLRQFPRDDGLRRTPRRTNPTSKQGSLRKGPRGNYT